MRYGDVSARFGRKHHLVHSKIGQIDKPGRDELGDKQSRSNRQQRALDKLHPAGLYLSPVSVWSNSNMAKYQRDLIGFSSFRQRLSTAAQHPTVFHPLIFTK
jgi:hypothetical protein